MTGGDAFTTGGPGLRTALVARFLLELALLAGAAAAAWRLTPGGWAWVTALAAVVLIAVIWGAFLSPQARITIPVPARVVLEAVLFGGAGVALWVTGIGGAGIALFSAWALDRIAIAVLR
ncbi:YrdB family protein [Microbacterium sp. KUDC0406]|uniref:YrdB family protein n=1 Tax=Microbacterium sp. KUDC0406 TaxID=2909588 RepID=UPI001F45602B|nr:YrdB family protein [Microbacterium sp. KUDC0406]UJP10488.1 YrdB family protein [Microbacterium sp. KUDC0406]